MDRSESLIANSFLFLNVDVKSYQRRYNRQTSLTQRSGIRWSETLRCYCPVRSISRLNCKISLALTIFNARLNRTCMAGGDWKFRSVSRAGHNSVTGKSRVWIAGGLGGGWTRGWTPSSCLQTLIFWVKIGFKFQPLGKIHFDIWPRQFF